MGIGNIADTGMQAAMTNMEVISNNIANANTVGFKKSYISFADIYPTATGSSSNQAGLGVGVSGVNQNFSTGGFMITGQSLDMSINKGGFFCLRDSSSGQTTYTRAGRFQTTNDGYITAGGTTCLQGFVAQNNKIPPGGSVSDLKINNGPLQATATSTLTEQINLNSSASVITGSIDPTSQSTYNFSSNGYAFDSLGNKHDVVSYYAKSADNEWNVDVYVDGTKATSGTMSFTSSGNLSATTGLSSFTFAPGTGATSPQTLSIDLSGSTQVSSPNSVTKNESNGYEAGTYQGCGVDKDGMVWMTYSNGQKVLAGQVAIANFQSPENLSNVGNMQWTSTTASGNAIYNQSYSTGNINAGALEQSNVDLTSEMVSLLNAQHTFQANAQVERTYSQVMEDVIKL